MNSYSEFYEKKLYPLQDGVLKSVSQCSTRFFLTGGTALSRGYFNHRYSDDLDFFVNDDTQFNEQLDSILDRLVKDGYTWSREKDYFRSESFCSLKLSESVSDTLLKVDFVNDVAPHFGGFSETKVFYNTDSIANITSNKVTALFRFEMKDIADLREIALKTKFNWIDIVIEAREKEAGLELPLLSQILLGVPRDRFDSVRWVNPPSWDEFMADLETMAYDMLSGEDNSLCGSDL